MVRFLYLFLILAMLSPQAHADDSYLIIVDKKMVYVPDALTGFPGRCFGKTADKIYLWGGGAEISWLENNSIQFGFATLDIDENPSLYLCYISDDKIGLIDQEILDRGTGYVLTKAPVDEAVFIRRLPLRSLPLGVGDERSIVIPTYDPYIDSLIGEISTDSLTGFLSGLTGEEQVDIGGQPETIDTRYSGTDDNLLATQFLRETLEGYGYQVEYHGFYGGSFRHVATHGESLAWTVTSDSRALRTTDGGITWHEIPDNSSSFLWGVSNIGPDSVWITGDDGTIRFSSNGGDSFISQSGGTSAFLFGLCFINSSEGWITGDNGLILHTTNSGQNWSSQSTPTGNRLYDVCFFDSDNGWAVGREGTIIHSTNGGNSWVSQNSNTSERIYSVDFVSNAEGWVVGWSGVVRHTTNGGTAWQTVNLGTTVEKYHVDFTDPLHGCIVGWLGEIFVTTNGGSNWNQMTSGTSNNLYGMEFADQSTGYAVGNSVILKTTDGGANWINQTGGIEGVWRNVIATKPGGVYPDQQVIVCGHMDSRSEQPETDAPGADDNGSGTTAVIEAARILAFTNFEKTIKFCLWNGEEQGLLGSAAYAEDAYNRGDNIVGVFNLDMIAYDGNDDGSAELHCGTMSSSIELGEIFDGVITEYNINLDPDLLTWNSTGASDHASFWDYNYPAMLGIEDYSNDFNPYYHSTSDNIFNIVPGYFTEYAKAALGATATLAVVMGGMPTNGVIEGMVTDESASPIAEVYVSAVGTIIDDITDINGEYLLADLAPGTYDVSFSHVAYRDTTVNGVEVFESDTTILNVILEESLEPVPTLSEWGMMILALLLLAAGTVALIRRRKAIGVKAD